MRRSTSPLRFAYADPPYPGKAGYYRGHPDFAGEVDHVELIASLVANYDGWALSTSAAALRDVLALCPPEVRVAAWFRGARPHATTGVVLSSWEPVVFAGARWLDPSWRSPSDASRVAGVDERRIDSLQHVARARTTDPDRVIGAKPAAFCWWLFQLLGLQAGDTFVDLFPGSGGVGRAWQLLEASALTTVDASLRPGGDSSPEYSSDASCPTSAAGLVAGEDLHDPGLREVRGAGDGGGGHAAAVVGLDEQLVAELDGGLEGVAVGVDVLGGSLESGEEVGFGTADSVT